MSVTVAAVMVTGILGNLAAPFLVKLFRIHDPLAVGLGIGACSHAVGTAKALEMGETEGAMGGLAIGLCGVITAILRWAWTSCCKAAGRELRSPAAWPRRDLNDDMRKLPRGPDRRSAGEFFGRYQWIRRRTADPHRPGRARTPVR